MTASEVYKVLAKNKDGRASAMREGYLAQKVAERRCGRPCERKYTNQAMLDGIEREATARAQYALECLDRVTEVGFVEHPVIVRAGASPDAVVGDHGVLEIKCPEWAAHLRAIHGRNTQEHDPQIQFVLACTGRAWCDLISYHPDFLDDSERLIVTRVMRNETKIAEIEREVVAFLHEVENEVEALERRRMLREAKAA